MSRREEVEATWDHWGCTKTVAEIAGLAMEQSKTLASEVDERDAVIDKLLAMLEPEKPDCYQVGCRCRACADYRRKRESYINTLEIAGRASTKPEPCKRCEGTGITVRLVGPRHRQNEVCDSCNGTGSEK